MIFHVPHTAKVQKVIPKKAFDAYTTSKQKKLFTDQIARITWLYKLSPDTVNLEAKEVKEIQVFKVELKIKEDISTVIEVIDKAIPYNIIFIVEYQADIYLSTSIKHSHPVKDSNSVVDWTFKSAWFSPNESKYSLNLKRSLDAVYHDFCIQLSGKFSMAKKPLKNLVEFSMQRDSLEREIVQLKNNIKNCKQFKIKVELNLLLKQKTKELNELIF